MKQKTIKILQFFRVEQETINKIRVMKNFILQSLSKAGLCQAINYKTIPIIIISYNQLNFLKQLVGFLKSRNHSNIVIIDNNSTYKPLLDYFDSIESTVSLHRLNENMGHLVFWKNKKLFDKYSKGYYVITDSDIVPDSECPSDFLKHFRNILMHNETVTKVGFSLMINDIPETNSNKSKILKWESQFHQNKNSKGDSLTSIDTTFALYRPNYKYSEESFFAAIRTGKPYQSRHGGWYLDTKNLSEEQSYFYRNCNESSSWRIDEQGDLINKELL